MKSSVDTLVSFLTLQGMISVIPCYYDVGCKSVIDFHIIMLGIFLLFLVFQNFYYEMMLNFVKGADVALRRQLCGVFSLDSVYKLYYVNLFAHVA
jgi:hypothetical protein